MHTPFFRFSLSLCLYTYERNNQFVNELSGKLILENVRDGQMDVLKMLRFGIEDKFVFNKIRFK
jgi:hypothetical protein